MAEIEVRIGMKGGAASSMITIAASMAANDDRDTEL
jgi:hypothetical protein